MSKPKSEVKKIAILNAAIEVIAEVGLFASTAEIAKRAKVSSGSIFTYFETKNTLFNILYLEIKKDIFFKISPKIKVESKLKENFKELWFSWVSWGVENPLKLRAFQYLSVSDVITEETEIELDKLSEIFLTLLHEVHENVFSKEIPFDYFYSIIEGMASVTISHVIQNDGDLENMSDFSFKFLWNAINKKA